MKFLFTILLMLLPSFAMSEVDYDKDSKTLKIVGPTNMQQVVSAMNHLREDEVTYVVMWGPGGSLTLGLQLGVMLRKQDVIVLIPKDKSCISACGFAAMGATHIRIDGEMMLHRPYIAGISSMDTVENSLAYMGRGYLLTAYYLEDMGYNRNIMDNLMKYTNPCKFMKYEELEVKEPKDLIMWVSEDRCEMFKMMLNMQR